MVNVSFLSRWTAEDFQVWFGRFAVFVKACFLPLKMFVHTININRTSVASVQKDK